MNWVLILVFGMFFMTGSANATITGTPHDLVTGVDAGGSAYSGASLSSCQYCHGAHSRSGSVPLWTRTMEADAVFSPYGSTASGTQITTIGPNSKACLGCHDGNIGIGTTIVGSDIIASADLTAGKISIGLNTNLGSDLTNDHPVGFKPTNTYAGVAYNSGTETITGQNGAPDFPLFGDTGSKQMECGTCHDPHDNTTNSKFLRRPRGLICTDCHIY